MYAVALLFIYVPLSIWSKHRNVWAIISFITAIELIARLIYGHNDIELYVIRATTALLGGSLSWGDTRDNFGLYFGA